jgi:hypothetical protein
VNVHPDREARQRETIAALRASRVVWLPSRTYWRMHPFDRHYWFINASGARA